jgi:hypothetical protein
VKQVHQLKPRDDLQILSRFFAAKMNPVFMFDLVKSGVKFAAPLMVLILLGLNGCISIGGSCYLQAISLSTSKQAVRAGETLTLVANEVTVPTNIPACGSIRKAVFRNGETIIGEDAQAPYSLVWNPVSDKDGVQPGFGTFDLNLNAIFVYDLPSDQTPPPPLPSSVRVRYSNSEATP